MRRHLPKTTNRACHTRKQHISDSRLAKRRTAMPLRAGSVYGRNGQVRSVLLHDRHDRTKRVQIPAPNINHVKGAKARGG